MNNTNDNFVQNVSELLKNDEVKCVLGANAQLPKQSTNGAAGYDLRSTVSITIAPYCYELIPTNLKVQLPPNMAMFIMPRSGLAAKHGVTVLNAPGLIDEDYRGVIQVLLINHHNYPCIIEKGDRIAQAVFIEVKHPELVVVDQLDETTRNDGGFGSTGVK